jgi:hypothetical protein
MMGQSIADVTVIVFFVAGSPLQEHLEVSFRTVRAHISFVRFKVLEAHIGVLGFWHYSLSVNTTLAEVAVGKTIDSVAEQRASRWLFTMNSSWLNLVGVRRVRHVRVVIKIWWRHVAKISFRTRTTVEWLLFFLIMKSRNWFSWLGLKRS